MSIPAPIGLLPSETGPVTESVGVPERKERRKMKEGR
jgi:hypothetical protein